MSRAAFITETLITSVEPKRTFRMAEECLLEIRLVENRKEGFKWIYEYEVKGEAGKYQKFLVRIKNLENLNSR